MHWLYLALAIVCEVVGTTALRATNGFSAPGPSALVVLAYAASFYAISLTLDAIPLAVAYAIWSGAGMALIALAGMFFYRQSLSFGEILGVALIMLGVVVLNLFGKGAAH
jgi:small multidrug resistance pump